MWGYLPQNDKPVLLAYRNNQTAGLYRCTLNVFKFHKQTIHAQDKYDNEVQAYRTLHTYETDKLLTIIRHLGHASVDMFTKIMKTRSNEALNISKKMIKRYANMPQEPRLSSSMTKPTYTKTTGRGSLTATPGIKEKIEYLNELQGVTRHN